VLNEAMVTFHGVVLTQAHGQFYIYLVVKGQII